MTFKPLHDQVILEIINVEQKTTSGIILAQTDDRPGDTVYGRVLAAGPGKAYDSGGIIPMVVKPGDIVIFKPNIAIMHLYMNKEYYIVRESNLASIVEGVTESQYAEIDPKALTTQVRELESLL